MIKNSEWAVASYLSQSEYGKIGNRNFQGINKEIYQNKSNSFITGCSYGKPSREGTDYGCHYTYDIEINGTGASTTGTIYGVYDMSGGAWEYVMGNYNDVIKNAGFSSMPALKYYDKYTNSDFLTACNGSVCNSHSLSETSGWYNDSNSMVNNEYPWFVRGGYYGDDVCAGAFYFYCTGSAGGFTSGHSFRLALAIT